MRIGLGGWSGPLAVLVVMTAADPAAALTACDLTFTLEGWSVFYKAADGSGIVRCDNGQEVRVRLETRGGGLTFGRSKIVGGTGDFSPVADIGEVFGDYAAAEAHAGMGISSGAQIVTRGSVSLALSGTGNGIDLGFAFGRFTIMRATRREPIERPRQERFRDEDLPPASGSTEIY
ncbi:MAG: hypothetical protein IT294_07165 [Deltaproteobacteria bacterium]|nr:hypothetical protein [Deltaproteobacteria bacterium]